MSDLEIEFSGRRMRLTVIDESIIRVQCTAAEGFNDEPSLMILPQTPTRAFDRVEGPDCITLKTAKLQARIRRETGAIAWLDAAGNLLVREPDAGGKFLDPIPVERRVFDASTKIESDRTVDGLKARVANAKVVFDRTAYSTKLELCFSPGEAIYGLGQHEEGILNYRGQSQFLYQQNLKKAMPTIVSTRGYGILWDTSSLAAFHDDRHGGYFWTEVDDEIDFYFLAGPEFDSIVASVRKLTGRSTLFPRWAFGYIQSKERYRTQQELIDVVAEYRRRQIPLDCIVQDWCSWKGNQWGYKTPDPERFPEVSALMHDLHAMDAKLMVSIWPIMRGECADQVEMRERGFLLGNDATYNAFDPAARELYWQQANNGWFRHGTDAWWCDCTEPFDADWKGSIKPDPAKRAVLNTNESKTFLDPEQINAYSLHHSRGIYEHQRAADPSRRVVNLTRSGFPGQQRYGAITWSGDIPARWQTLRRQIADGLNFCVTGNPKWTLDIGAFFVGRKEQWFWRGDYPGGCEDPGYRELYARWMQLGVFLPMMRAHGTDTPREVWRFGNPGEPAYDAIVRAIQLRYQLLPYIYSLAAMETLNDYTMMRMLAFDFRHDPAVYDIDDQYLFGPALMACPVTEPGVTSRTVYLPAGCTWWDFWTGAGHDGGQPIDTPTPLNTLPLFVRAGSILPLGPSVQHAGEALDAPIEVRVYPGANGAFDFYEDANDGYGYEQGEYCITTLTWDDATRQLQVGRRRGELAERLPVRRFDVVIVKGAD